MSAGITAGILAAGTGERLGGVCKALVEVRGEPAIVRVVRTLRCHCSEVLVAVREDWLEAVRAEVDRAGEGAGVRWISGGADRIATALKLAQAAGDERLLLHDVARPDLSPEAVHRLVESAGEGGAACIGIPCGRRDAVGVVREGELRLELPKHEVFRLQTPVLADRRVFEAALSRVAPESKLSLAGLLQAAGERVRVVPSDSEIRKLTFPEDLAWFAGGGADRHP